MMNNLDIIFKSQGPKNNSPKTASLLLIFNQLQNSIKHNLIKLSTYQISKN